MLLVEEESAGTLSAVTLTEELTEVNAWLQQRSHLDYLYWATNMRLEDLSAKV